ncbi:MAG: 2-oxoglutarate dehydrogenase E1 component [bacterium]
MDGPGTYALYAGNSEFLESLYETYLTDPAAVEPQWRVYFDTIQGGEAPGGRVGEDEIRRFHKAQVRKRAAGDRAGTRAGDGSAMARKQAAVSRLIRAYRTLGHHCAALDPIHLRGLPHIPDLDPYFHGLTDADMDLTFNTGTLVAKDEMTLREIVEMLKETYTESIGAEYMHICDSEEKRWLQNRIESTRTNPDFTAEFKKNLLRRLTAAEGLEVHLHTKYAGQKRFSLEGGEALITSMDEIIHGAGAQGVQELVIGMAHRGRLNVLVNIMGKSPMELFSEFEGKHTWRFDATGDVKYHQGHSSDVLTAGGPMHLALGFNPSHLEIIDPVTVGSVRSRQERRGDVDHTKVMALLIHGDAAFAGQGVVYETLNLSQTRGCTTGGTIHIIVNNRIGFTTSHPLDTRSALYCTDVGKVVQAPIFHVNGDDPEAVAFVTKLAVEFRMTFKCDVIIDIICYRRHGHNEADEPAATQPMMYRKIRRHETVRQVYARKLATEGVIGTDEADGMVKTYRDALDAGEQVVPNIITGKKNPHRVDWSIFRKAQWDDPVNTGVPASEIKRLGAILSNLPEDVELHPRVAKIIDDRSKMAAGALPVDWGFAEIMAFATLLKDGFTIRMSGQDSGRGTFFHRHAVLHNQRTGDEYIPLQHISEKQPHFTIIDSILSEEAVLGFEYGFSAADPTALVVWEAQFGDFVNGAQVVIDQFISAAEQKWGLLTGLVLMLPHGWEGQGPEHTSARLERFLQLCAQENVQVCNPSTAAQMFHVLRRQMVRKYRKPLILMTPKSMLRRKISFSSIDDFASEGFQVVIGEIDPLKSAEVKRIVMCSGKVYYDILEARRERNMASTAILRLEQMYPFPAKALTRELSKFPKATEFIWAQEEPQNQGAWYLIQHALRTCIQPGQDLHYAGRPASAAPAGGDYHRHLERQERVVEDALGVSRQGAVDVSTKPQLIDHPAPTPTGEKAT